MISETDIKNGKVFRTRTGFCHILPDAIVLSKNEKIETIVQEPAAGMPAIGKLIYIVVALAISGLLFNAYKEHKLTAVTSVIVLILCLVFLYIISNALKPGINYIKRNQVFKVTHSSGLGSLTHARFIIYFKNERGRMRAVNIILRDPNIFGKNEREDALKIMMEEKLIEPKIAPLQERQP